MADQTDDRLTLSQQLLIAENARRGGFFSRRRFRELFQPARVVAMLLHIEVVNVTLNDYAGQVKRVRELIAKWRAEGDDLAAKELEEALAPPPAPAPQEDAASDNL